MAAPCEAGHPWIFQSSLAAPGRHRTRSLLRPRISLPIWSCSVWGLPCPGLYSPGGALLPHLFTLTSAGLAVQANLKGPSGIPTHLLRSGGVAQAVYSLWHLPSLRLDAQIPDVIRHTTLRSSDFPPPMHMVFYNSKASAATAQLPCWFYSTRNEGSQGRRGSSGKVVSSSAISGRSTDTRFVTAHALYEKLF